jgi:hypothetical protein
VEKSEMGIEEMMVYLIYFSKVEKSEMGIEEMMVYK